MSKDFLDRNLALEAVRVTEAAALSSSLHMGRGDEKAADQAAVNAMRDFLNNLAIDGKVDIPTNHLQYAITWYSLAIGLLVIYFSWHHSKGRLKI